MDKRQIIYRVLNYVKRRNDEMLYAYFRRHHRTIAIEDFKSPSRSFPISKRFKSLKENIRAKQAKVLLNTDFDSAKQSSDSRDSNLKWNWSWDNKKIPAERFTLGLFSN